MNYEPKYQIGEEVCIKMVVKDIYIMADKGISYNLEIPDSENQVVQNTTVSIFHVKEEYVERDNPKGGQHGEDNL